MDPDEEVSGAVAQVFASFTQTGSANAVVGALAKRRFPPRAYAGAWAGQLRFGSLTHSRGCSILSNPVSAGAYVYGRFRSNRTVTPDGGVHTSTAELLRAQWAGCIHDHHLGYISWASFLANEAKLAGNRTDAGARPPREATDVRSQLGTPLLSISSLRSMCSSTWATPSSPAVGARWSAAEIVSG
jgi:hypothetical protein